MNGKWSLVTEGIMRIADFKLVKIDTHILFSHHLLWAAYLDVHSIEPNSDFKTSNT